MENKLPEDIQIRIAKEAESLANQWHYYPSGDEYRDIINAYKAGAEPWAQQCQQMAKALESLLKYRSDNGYLKRGLTIGAIRESYERYNEAILNAETLLATWNEGKEPNKNTTNDTNK